MSYAQQQRNPTKHMVGIGLVLLLHIMIVWGLANGLARKMVQAIKAPIETKIIEEVKPPPPPPPKIALPPPPRFAPPPPAFVPPPEIKVQAPPPAPTAITVTTAEPPPAPPPVAAPRVEAPPAPPPARVVASVACANYSAVMGEAGFPREATRYGLEEGDALIEFTLTANGEVRDVKAVRASHPVFARNSVRIVSTYKCAGQGRDVVVQVPFAYRLD